MKIQANIEMKNDATTFHIDTIPFGTCDSLFLEKPYDCNEEASTIRELIEGETTNWRSNSARTKIFFPRGKGMPLAYFILNCQQLKIDFTFNFGETFAPEEFPLDEKPNNPYWPD